MSHTYFMNDMLALDDERYTNNHRHNEQKR